MPVLFNLGGAGDACLGGPCSYALADSTLFLPAMPNYDVCYRPCKRSRVGAPLVFRADEQEASNDVKESYISSMDALPDECIFEILRRLSGNKERCIAACVSKRWLLLLSTICRSELLGSEFTIEGEGHLSRCLKETEATDLRLAAVSIGTGGHGGIEELSIKGSDRIHGVTDFGLLAIGRGCPSLRVLSLWDVPSVGDEGLSAIAKGCPMLEKLSLYKCPLVSDKSLAIIAHLCPNLRTLTIESCANIRNEALRAIGSCCSKLQFVSIRKCVGVGDQGIIGLVVSASASLEKIILHSLSVTDVALAVLGHYGRDVNNLVLSGLQFVTEKGFWVMGSALGMQKLKSLTIVSCCGVTDLGLEAIVKGSPFLKQLCIRNCCGLSDSGLKSLSELAMDLEDLRLVECNKITLMGVLGASPLNNKLKSLYLARCFGIKNLVSHPTVLSPRCPSLRSIAIRDCPGFSSFGLHLVGEICPKLQRIELSGLPGLTDAGLTRLIECSEPGIEKVVLSGCVNVSDNVIFALVGKHGSALQVLHLVGCKRITDRSLFAVSDSCPQLLDLDISGCSVTDFGVETLAEAKARLKLQILSMSGCSLMTKRSFPHLRKIGGTLRGLNLKKCEGFIDEYGLRALEEKLWWCDILS